MNNIKMVNKMNINLKSKKQQGSFFAEIGAVVASISILTLISTSYMDSMAGRAQVAEAFVLMQPIVENVNTFYSNHGAIGIQGTGADTDPLAVGDTPDGNYESIDVYDNDASGNNPNDFAGRYVQNVQSYTNGVVVARMNPQHNDSYFSKQYVGKVSNVQTAIQGEFIFLVPWLIGDTAAGDASENTSLRWSCLTTIDANPPTGSILEAYNLTNSTINEQYFYAPGCVVISAAQANCLSPSGDAGTGGGTCGTPHLAPINWNKTINDLFT